MRFWCALLLSVLSVVLMAPASADDSALAEKVEPDVLEDPSHVVDVLVESDGEISDSIEELAPVSSETIGDDLYALSIEKSKLDDLAKIDAVVSVELDSDYKLLLDASIPLMGASSFWSLGYNGTGVSVCVIDTGVDSSHSALSGRVVAAKDFVTSDSDGDSNSDFHGHGTHVAGIIASGDATYRGAAFGSSIMSAKVFSSTTETAAESDIILGIDWCVDNGAKVLSLSLGAGDETNDGSDILSNYLDSVVDQGKIVIVSAGNSGPSGDSACRTSRDSSGSSYSICSPALSHKSVAVGSVQTGKSGTSARVVSGFSSRGPTGDGRTSPDVLAPGEPITSTLPGGFGSGSGTSMSAPHVSALAALAVSARSNVTPSEFKAVLMNTPFGFQSGKNNTYGSGSVNATEFLSGLQKSLVGYISSGGNRTHNVTVNGSTPYIKATLYWPENHSVHNNLDMILVDPTGAVRANSSSIYNTDESIYFAQMSPLGNWSIVVVPTSVSGNQSYALAANIAPEQNSTSNPPAPNHTYLIEPSFLPSIQKQNGNVTFFARVSDMDGVSSVYMVGYNSTWVQSHQATNLSLSSGSWVGSVNVSNVSVGTYYFNVTVVDGLGNVTVFWAANVTVNDTAPSVFSGESLSTSGGGLDLNITNETGSELDLRTLQDISGFSIFVASYSSNPEARNAGLSELGRFIQIETTSQLSSNLSWAILRVRYNDTDLQSRNLDEGSLRLYHFNENSSSWSAFSGLNGSVNTTGNFVWANTTHFSTFGVFGSGVEPAPTSSPTPSSGGGGGGGGGGSSVSKKATNSTIPPANVTVPEKIYLPLRNVSVVEAVADETPALDSASDGGEVVYEPVSFTGYFVAGQPASFVGVVVGILGLVALSSILVYRRIRKG